MADQQHRAARLAVALDLAMDLGDQRTGGVGEQQPAAARLGRHGLGHAVGREHDQPVLGHLVQLLDEHRTQAAQFVDHVAIVDDLVADIDRRAVLAQGLLDHVDRALDPGAEAARAGEQDGERLVGGRRARARGSQARTDGGCLAQSPQRCENTAASLPAKRCWPWKAGTCRRLRCSRSWSLWPGHPPLDHVCAPPSTQFTARLAPGASRENAGIVTSKRSP